MKTSILYSFSMGKQNLLVLAAVVIVLVILVSELTVLTY